MLTIAKEVSVNNFDVLRYYVYVDICNWHIFRYDFVNVGRIIGYIFIVDSTLVKDKWKRTFTKQNRFDAMQYQPYSIY